MFLIFNSILKCLTVLVNTRYFTLNNSKFNSLNISFKTTLLIKIEIRVIIQVSLMSFLLEMPKKYGKLLFRKKLRIIKIVLINIIVFVIFVEIIYLGKLIQFLIKN